MNFIMKKLLQYYFFISINLLSQSDNWKIYNNLNSPPPSNKITSSVVDIEGNVFWNT